MFVTVDGPNGSGKTTLSAAVTARLTARGHVVHHTAQPSSSPLGKLARECERTVRGRALACLVAADRHHQLETEIAPALARGEIVLCDRYVESSLVLQRIDAVEIEYILAVNAGILRPDLRIRLLADETALRQRIAARPSNSARRFERAANGSARELRLYAEADDLLLRHYGLTALVYDTTSSEADALGEQVAAEITA
jgi:dTMP kinase